MEELVVLDGLEKSAEYMCSDDWKKRFIAEYAQLVTRIDKLLDYLWEEDLEDSEKDSCPTGLLAMQLDKMGEYQQLLEIRAEIYGIDLNQEIYNLNGKKIEESF